MAAMYKEVLQPLLNVDPESPTKEIPDDEEHTRRPTSFRLATVVAAILGLIVFAGVAVTYSRSNNLPHKAHVTETIGLDFENTDPYGGDISQKVDKSKHYKGTFNLQTEKACSQNDFIDCTGKCQWDEGMHSCMAKGFSAQHICAPLKSKTDCKTTGFCEWEEAEKDNGWIALCHASCEHALENLLGSKIVRKHGVAEVAEVRSAEVRSGGSACPAKPVTLEQIAGACPGGELTKIKLGSCKVTGDIASLSDLKNLDILDLRRTKVTGDIASLSHLKGLTQINLYDTKVTGDIASLSDLKNLDILDLRYTKVTGDIASLSDLKNLGKLDLGYTKVSGDIVSLPHMKQLKVVRLPLTEVTGDIASLSHMKNLDKLDLWKTKVCENPPLEDSFLGKLDPC